jgi:hypothetical protein
MRNVAADAGKSLPVDAQGRARPSGPPSSGVEDRVCQRFDVAPTGTPDSRRSASAAAMRSATSSSWR